MYRSVSVLLLIVLSASALTLVPNRTDPIEEKCIRESGIDRSLIENPVNDAAMTSPKMKCFIACGMRERGTLTSDGRFNATSVTDNLPVNLANRDKVINAFNECSHETPGENECETAFKIASCLYNKEEIRTMHPI